MLNKEKVKSLVSMGVFIVTTVVTQPSLAQCLDDSYISSAISSSQRSDADKKRDGQRKPKEVLSLMAIKPGTTVLDLNSSEGYYAELLSRVVGDSGKVIAHNDPTYMAFLNKNKHQKRFENNRLSNVEHYQPSSDNLDLSENSVDSAVMALAFHDYYYVNAARNDKIADVIAVAKSIYKALKPGAKLVIIDHVGKHGGTAKDWHDIHRVAPETVKSTFLQAGFELFQEASFLSNPEDDHLSTPFDEKVRGNTDRFVQVFQK